MLKIFEFRINSSEISLILTELCIRILTARKALLSDFEGKHILFWTSSIASFDGMYSIFCSDARASYASLPQCSLFPFSLLSCGPFLYFGSTAASLKWFFSRRCFSWFSLDSKNSDRTPIWKVRMVRSLADRTFQPRPLALLGGQTPRRRLRISRLR